MGDGGAIFTNNDDLAKRMRSIANHGMSEKYVYQQVGVNSRLDAIQAAILDVKLKYLDQYIQARQTAAAFYDNHLKDIPEIKIPERVDYSTHTFHQYTIKVAEKRDELQAFLKSKGIPSMVYYPRPLHLQEAYKYLGYKTGDFPIAEKLSEQVLSLPMHTELDDAQLTWIVRPFGNSSKMTTPYFAHESAIIDPDVRSAKVHESGTFRISCPIA
jgi:dTDP-4-amino-4,6-dideoxygalactose transaminase